MHLFFPPPLIENYVLKWLFEDIRSHTHVMKAFSLLPLCFNPPPRFGTVVVRQLHVLHSVAWKSRQKISTAGSYKGSHLLWTFFFFFYVSRFCFYLSHLQRLRMASGRRLRAISYNDFQAGEGWESELAFCSRLSHNYAGAPPNRNKNFRT